MSFFAKFQFSNFLRKAVARVGERHQVDGLSRDGRSWGVIFDKPVFRGMGRDGGVNDAWACRRYASAGCYFEIQIPAS